MAYEKKEFDNTNRGVLFVAKEKRNEKSPDYSGNINIEGKEFWVSGWKSFSKKDGSMYLSLMVNPKEAQKVSGPAPVKSAFGIDNPADAGPSGDGLPF